MPGRLASSSRPEHGFRHALCLVAVTVVVASFLLAKGRAAAQSFSTGEPIDSGIRIALVGPSNPSAEVSRELTLLRGELLSVGFAVTVVERLVGDGAAGAESRGWFERLAARGMSAAVEPIGSDALEGVDVWLLVTGPRFEVIRMGADPQTTGRPEVLALRVVEALRARLLDGPWADRKRREEDPPPAALKSGLPASPAPANAPAVVVSSAAAPEERREAAGGFARLGVEAGAALVTTFDGVGPAVLPTLRAAWSVRPSLVLVLAGAAFGSASTVTASTAAAHVRQQEVVAGARYGVRAEDRLAPFAGVAAGLLHTAIEGEAGPAARAHAETRWSALVDVSLGSHLRMSRRFYLTLSAHAQLAAPYVAISLLDEAVATVGRPNLLITLTLGMWL